MVFATSYPRIHFKLHFNRLFLGEGWSSPLRIHVSAYPLHDQTTLILFLGKGWSLRLRSHVSTLFREAPLKWQGILQGILQLLPTKKSLACTGQSHKHLTPEVDLQFVAINPACLVELGIVVGLPETTELT